MTMKEQSKEPLLEVRDLCVDFRVPGGYATAIRGVDLTVGRGEVVGLVGESGSGKSISMMALLRLLPAAARVSGTARFDGVDLLSLSPRELSHIRGGRIGMIFQDPLTAFNPVLTIGAQIVEALQLHDHNLSGKAAWTRAVELLAEVAIPEPGRRVHQYPHEFSGGMRQRAMIAMAISNRPQLLIADEPTTALDVTVQAQILELLQRLREELNIGMIMITHDLGVVAGIADRVMVMYSGRVIERGEVDDVFYASRHPYTRGLLAALPKLDGGREALVGIAGTPPSLVNRPAGCAFRPRCGHAEAVCATAEPPLLRAGQLESACYVSDRLSGMTP
ncbi:ABC transporter ATP-binding protein [Paracoccus sp. PAR01]|nr:ABC transporter ATP-binding protein [Paracoccus sp. PAR01]